MYTDPSTDEESSGEYEDSDDSLESITNSMKASSFCPIEPRNALTRGPDTVLQNASQNGFSKLLCPMFFHAGCIPFAAIARHCLLVPV